MYFFVLFCRLTFEPEESDENLFVDPNIPPLIREGQCIAADAAAKGLQAALIEFQHGGLESCEISAVYATRYAKNEKGVHWASKSKIPQCVNGKGDATMTGHGALHLDVPGLHCSKDRIPVHYGNFLIFDYSLFSQRFPLLRAPGLPPTCSGVHLSPFRVRTA